MLEGVETRELSYSVGGNVSWHNRCGKQYGGSQKTKNRNYHMIQQSHPWADTQIKL